MEEDFDDGLGGYVEDDANHEADNALADVLRRVQFSGASLPKISVAGLLELVKKEPGGEAIDKDTLEKSKSNNETVKGLIKAIEPDQKGILYVYLNPPEAQDDQTMGGEGEPGQGGAPAQTAPEKTVSGMASRALSSRS
jgi:hypothetical protein